MPVKVAMYRVLIASPSDLARERKAMREVMHAWNEQHAIEYGVSYLPVMWEFAAIPEMGDRPQAILNRQLGDSDMLVGAFWARIGTPTEVDVSGTVEEISRFRDAGKDVLLYFSNRAIPPNRIDRDQYAQVKLFHALCNREGLTQEFGSVDGLRTHLNRHLTGLARKRKAQAERPPFIRESSAQPMTLESDRSLFCMIRTTLLPSTGSIHFVRGNDFGGRFVRQHLDDLHNVDAQRRSSELEFFDRELEGLWVRLLDAIRLFLNDIGRLTWPNAVSVSVQEIPREWRESDHERFIQAVSTLNQGADKVWEAYDQFIRLGREKLGL